MYTAVIRRTTNGIGIKTAKRTSGDLFLRDTKSANLQTFFHSWPRHLTSYLCYGRSTKTELSFPSLTSPLAGAMQRRSYGVLALRDEEAAKEAARLDSGGGGLLSYPNVESMEPLKPATNQQQPPTIKKMTLHQISLKHKRAQPISMVTAYDYPTARLADAAKVDVLLVGDSVGMVVLGREDTTDVTMDEMVHHCRAASRGTERAMLLGDLPFGSCITPLDAARNGVRLVKEGRVDAVKLEGGARVVPHVEALIDAGVAVCGHIGLTPQSYSALGGYRVQGRTAEHAYKLVEEAKALEAAGCFAVVLEMVPAPVAAAITKELSIPTIGIGAGVHTSGQVQVFHDVLGLYDKVVPKFSKQFGKFEGPMVHALSAYTQAVDQKAFPHPIEHSFKMEIEEEGKFREALEKAADARVAAEAMEEPPEVEAVKSNGTSPHANGSPPPLLSGNNGRNHQLNAKSESANLSFAAAAGVHSTLSASLHIGAASQPPQVVRTVREWRQLQSAGVVPHNGLGLVPTMGALHEGHLSLMRRAQRENEATAASIFVNPKQFAAHEDLGTYPRPWEADLTKLTKLGVDFVFAPEPEEMYPPHRPSRLSPFIDLNDVDHGTAEGSSRPGFFRGVSTVVAKLLNITQPRAVYFGQKDGMQCVVVKRLIEDLNFNTKLVIAPTVREEDGLAMSSRNVYLNPTEREAAPAVYASLTALATKYNEGERKVDALRAHAVKVIDAEPMLTLDYLSLASAVDGRELTNGQRLEGSCEPTLASIAVRLGTTRLIDNVILE